MRQRLWGFLFVSGFSLSSCELGNALLDSLDLRLSAPKAVSLNAPLTARTVVSYDQAAENLPFQDANLSPLYTQLLSNFGVRYEVYVLKAGVAIDEKTPCSDLTLFESAPSSAYLMSQPAAAPLSFLRRHFEAKNDIRFLQPGSYYLKASLASTLTSTTPESEASLPAPSCQGPIKAANEPLRTDLLSGVGIIGTSLSEEYADFPGLSDIGFGFPGAGVNWMELLAAARSNAINFGRQSSIVLGAGQPWNDPPPIDPINDPNQSWIDTRKAGYEYNWAKGGADTFSILSTGQHAGLARQVQQNLVKLAVVEAGINDFLGGSINVNGRTYSVPILSIAINSFDYNPASADPAQGPKDLDDYFDQIVANMEKSVRYIQAANPNVEVMVFNLPSVTAIPIFRFLMDMGAWPVDSLGRSAKTRFRDAFILLNDKIDAMAQRNNCGLVDLFEITDVWEPIILNPGTIQIAGKTVEFFNVDLMLNSQELYGVNILGLLFNPENVGAEFSRLPIEVQQRFRNFAFLPDGFHPNTIASGFIANRFLEAVNQRFNLSVPLFSELEIITNAGISP